MTNYADKGFSINAEWRAIEIDGRVVAVAPKEYADRIAKTLRDAEELAKQLPPHRCPVCESDQVFVDDSRPRLRVFYRRRRCESCGATWQTHERYVRMINGGDRHDGCDISELLQPLKDEDDA